MTTKEQIAVMQAFLDGKTIECKILDVEEDPWEESSNPCWNWVEYDYRIKSEPKYRPYNSVEELLQASKEHGPYLQVIDKKPVGYKTYLLPIVIRGAWVDFNGDLSNDNIEHNECTYNHLLGKYEWQDGTPYGILE